MQGKSNAFNIFYSTDHLGLYLNYRKEIYYTKIIEENVRRYKENQNSSEKERSHNENKTNSQTKERRYKENQTITPAKEN